MEQSFTVLMQVLFYISCFQVTFNFQVIYISLFVVDLMTILDHISSLQSLLKLLETLNQ